MKLRTITVAAFVGLLAASCANSSNVIAGGGTISHPT